MSGDVIVTGWGLVPGWNVRVGQRYSPIFGQTFSHLIFEVTIHRSVLSALLKSLLPSLIIPLSSFAALLPHTPEKVQARTAAPGSALVAVVLFRLNMTSSPPPVGCLTCADRFSLINYVALFLDLISSVWLLVENSRRGREREGIAARAGRISHFFPRVIPALWRALPLLNLALF